MTKHSLQLGWRETLQAVDVKQIQLLVDHTGFFSDDEIRIAVELIELGIKQGEFSGYYFVICELHGRIIGYSCFGDIPGTQASFDVYWIAVDLEFQGLGVGKEILLKTETIVRNKRGRRIYIDTSGRAQYQPTHAFYEKSGYVLAARLKDFFSPGDDKFIFEKELKY